MLRNFRFYFISVKQHGKITIIFLFHVSIGWLVAYLNQISSDIFVACFIVLLLVLSPDFCFFFWIANKLYAFYQQINLDFIRINCIWMGMEYGEWSGVQTQKANIFFGKIGKTTAWNKSFIILVVSKPVHTQFYLR